MADLHKAEAAAREALVRYEVAKDAGEAATFQAYNCVAHLTVILAALDAARGEAVAWVDSDTLAEVEPQYALRTSLYGRNTSGDRVPLFAAPPAALAVPAEPIGWVFQHEDTGRMTFCANDGINTPEVFQRLNPRHVLCGPAYTQAQQPAAAVPEDAFSALLNCASRTAMLAAAERKGES